MQRKPEMPMSQGPAAAGGASPMGLGGQPAPEQQPGGMPSGTDDEAGFAGGGEMATPEEQKQYDAFVDNAYKLIYDEQTQGKVLEAIMGGGDPVMGLANTAATITLQVERNAEQGGVELAEGVVFNAGVEITEDLASFAKEAGAHDFSQEEVETAFYRAVDIYRAMQDSAGNIDRDARAAEFQALIQADKDGTLAKQMPQLVQAAAQQQGEAPMPAGHPSQPGAQQPGAQERR